MRLREPNDGDRPLGRRFTPEAQDLPADRAIGDEHVRAYLAQRARERAVLRGVQIRAA
ncbi:hypothetical protein [Streptomyces sp. NPDC102409]|uniref:hypothetical protein n=1 Tax=Streptomyces sp. NPDC102409 TaxID=3366172 RepID=UPI00380E62AF